MAAAPTDDEATALDLFMRARSVRLNPLSLEPLAPDAAWARKVPDGVTSHYKVDPETGEMMFFNYPERRP